MALAPLQMEGGRRREEEPRWSGKRRHSGPSVKPYPGELEKNRKRLASSLPQSHQWAWSANIALISPSPVHPFHSPADTPRQRRKNLEDGAGGTLDRPGLDDRLEMEPRESACLTRPLPRKGSPLAKGASQLAGSCGSHMWRLPPLGSQGHRGQSVPEQPRDRVHGTGGDQRARLGLAQPCPLNISSRQMKRGTSAWSQQVRAALGNPVITEYTPVSVTRCAWAL